MVEYSHIFPLAYDGKKCPISNTERQEGEGIGRLLRIAVTMYPKMKSALVRAASYNLRVFWLIQCGRYWILPVHLLNPCVGRSTQSVLAVYPSSFAIIQTIESMVEFVVSNLLRCGL